MRTLKAKFVVITMLVLAGCATVEGAGEDISTAGDAIAQESREVRSDL